MRYFVQIVYGRLVDTNTKHKWTSCQAQRRKVAHRDRKASVAKFALPTIKFDLNCKYISVSQQIGTHACKSHDDHKKYKLDQVSLYIESNVILIITDILNLKRLW